ncbi:glucosidase [Lachnospira multipara]|uniref:family 4 glycosyl hydrolase n=1 Tax=Lachnospira multipara TaxID=28051 RepID=UPI000489D5E6|nr:glucosidase [Lachnospira multipara]
MKKIKIAYIGGGSKQWARVFMYDLALVNDLCGEIGLYDIDIESAKRNKAIGENINKAPNVVTKWDYKVYSDLDSCLNNADFVVISILPGSFDEMRVDVETPIKYGIYQSVGDTAGPGGVMRALRTVPIYEEFAKAIKRICPKAWVINFTNPMTICTKTLFDVFPEIKAFGCCHEVFHTQDFLCDVLKEEKSYRPNRNEIYTEVSGINHFTWISSAKYKDDEIFDYLDDYIDKHFKEGHYEHGSNEQYKTDPFAYANRVKMDLYKRYGVLGAAGDRHLVEFFNNNWYLKNPEMVNEWKFALTSIDFRVNQMYERIQESKDLASGKKPIELKKSDEEAVDLMRAILGLTSKISNVNLINEGQMPQIKLDSIVETNAVFTHDSVRPIMAKPLPAAVLAQVNRCQTNVETLYEGIKNRDLKTVFASFVNQPLCSNLTLEDAKALFKEMCEKTKDYLSVYNLDELNSL